MSRRSANGMLRRNLFNIQSNPDSTAAPYSNTAARSSNHDFTATPYPSTAARSSRQSVTTALIDSRVATLPERGGLFCCKNRCYRNRTVSFWYQPGWNDYGNPSTTALQLIMDSCGQATAPLSHSMSRVRAQGSTKAPRR